MEKLHNPGLRESLAQLSVEELQRMLQAELEREESSPESVRMILSVLEERSAQEPPDHVPLLKEDQTDAAWETYQKRVEGLRKKKTGHRGWMMRAASLVLILGLLVAMVPQKAEAETFWEMLQRMSTEVLEFFSGEGKTAEIDYIFNTGNPGLQQIYDAVVELGVTEPVVPMWLPEGSELTEYKEKNTPMRDRITAHFMWRDSEIVYELSVFEGEPAHQFYRDDTYYDSYERNGATYIITRNNDRWSVIWTKENIEGHITLDCREETLRRILKSIYVMEE